MQHHLIWWLNYLLLALIAILIASGLFVLGMRTDLYQPSIKERKTALPATSFSQKDYSSLGTSNLQLEYQIPKMGVPDLQKVLNYRGRNMRPDAEGNQTLFFTLGNSSPFPVTVGNKHYLVSKNDPEEPYAISPDNRPTSLWFEPELRGVQVNIMTRMQDENGEVIGGPKGNFTLAEKPLPASSKTFMIDQMRADPTLLSRQKARWNGKDLFLEDHGGESFEKMEGKQRIIFGEGDNLYVVYVNKGDFLIWKEGRWHMPEPGEPTASFPLMQVNKIEERIMNLELFDLGGRIKVILNLIRLSEPPLQPLMIAQDFHFIGARTKIHSLFKVNNKREIVGPEDWFLLTQEGWKKLKTRKEIDAYVAGQLQGVLLIIDRINSFNEDRWLEATLYSRSRAQSEAVTLPLKSSPKTPAKEPPPKEEKKEETNQNRQFEEK